MPIPKYSKAEHARLGNSLYETRLRTIVEPGNKGRILAIDVDSGEYELGVDTLSAAERLLAGLPDAQVFCLRIGYQSVHRFGARA